MNKSINVGGKNKMINQKLNKKEEKKVKPKSRKDEEISEKEYNEIKKKCFFFMRRHLSQSDIFQNKDNKNTPNIRRKIKFKNKTHYAKDENDDMQKKNKNKKKEEKVVYDNLQPKSVWLNCKKIYNKYKSECQPIIRKSKSLLKKRKNNVVKFNIDNYNINKNDKKHFREDYPDPAKIPIMRTKSLNIKNINKKILKNNIASNNNNNFIKCINKQKNNNFINKGINYIIKNRDLFHISDLNKEKVEDDMNYIRGIKEMGAGMRNLPFLFSRKMNTSIVNKSTIDEIMKSPFYQYKLNYFFEIGNSKENNDEEDEENDLEILSKKGNALMRELLFTKKASLSYLKDNQSEFNFFNINKLFGIKDFYIFGVIHGRGKESQKFSRLLKEVLIEKFSDENNYLKASKVKYKPKNYRIKSDFIYYALTVEDYILIKKLFNSLTDELKIRGVDVEQTGATLTIIILIKDKIISIKLGDMSSFFIYYASDDKNLDHIIIKNPHSEQLIKNIIEQDRLEENGCVFNVIKNDRGQNDFELKSNDEEMQKYINKDKIKFTRILGYLKLKKIGIINEPDIQMFTMNNAQYENEIICSRRVISHVDPYYNYNLKKIINKRGFNITGGNLKYILIGSYGMFEFLKSRYFIKEIEEALLKDEEINKNKDNLKFCFNLKNVVKKLVKDSIEVHKKSIKDESLIERCLTLVTLSQNNIIQ